MPVIRVITTKELNRYAPFSLTSFLISASPDGRPTEAGQKVLKEALKPPAKFRFIPSDAESFGLNLKDLNEKEPGSLVYTMTIGCGAGRRSPEDFALLLTFADKLKIVVVTSPDDNAKFKRVCGLDMPERSPMAKSSAAAKPRFFTEQVDINAKLKALLTSASIFTVVNPTNENCIHGGGAAYAINSACPGYDRKNGEAPHVPVGTAKAFAVGPNGYIVNATGPFGREVKDSATFYSLLKITVQLAISAAARAMGFKGTVYLPCISGAIFAGRYDVKDITRVVVDAVKKLDKDLGDMRVCFYANTPDQIARFETALAA